MSYGSAYSSLFVICKTVKQRDELLARFQKEKPGQGEFIAELLFFCLRQGFEMLPEPV